MTIAEQKSLRIKRAASVRRNMGLPIGRPKTRNDEAIHFLRGEGLTMREIAGLVGCSAGTVCLSLREK